MYSVLWSLALIEQKLNIHIYMSVGLVSHILHALEMLLSKTVVENLCLVRK